MATGKTIKKRAVAGTFLFRFPEDRDGSSKVQVALFRRSGDVRTYQHKLAPISGSVEETDADPLATALREIKEETTLDLKSIELLRRGKPYSFTDDDIGREWTINPFAFRLKSVAEGGKGEAGITIDWEHVGWEWFDPLAVSESDGFGGVPRLVDSLRRVWPEYDLGPTAGNALTDGLETLRNDHESGARLLAAKAINVLKQVISEMDSSQVGDAVWWSKVRLAAWHLCHNGRESMGSAIISALVAVLGKIEVVVQETESNREQLNKRINEEIDKILAQRDGAIERVRSTFIDYLKANNLNGGKGQNTISVLTLSQSSTIASSLVEAASALGVTLDLRILESRPLCEGVTLASKILQAVGKNGKAKITLYSDASAAIAAQGVDIVLFGADRISSSGDVSNKTGTLPAVLSARHASPKAKIIVMSETEKIAKPGAIDQHPVEENDPAELSNGWNHGVKGTDTLGDYTLQAHDDSEQSSLVIKNVYFEWVPAGLISAYITDEGSWSVEDIKNKADWVGTQAGRFFNDL